MSEIRYRIAFMFAATALDKAKEKEKNIRRNQARKKHGISIEEIFKTRIEYQVLLLEVGEKQYIGSPRALLRPPP
jgi:hypothetical protein